MLIGSALSYPTAFTLGLLGSAHCIGMCGGIISALSFADKSGADKSGADKSGAETGRPSHGRQLLTQLTYNAGRLSSYTLAGVLVGSLGWVASQVSTGLWLRVLAGLMLIAMGLYLGNWWRGLTYLEKAGNFLWRRIQPLTRSLLPVRSAGQAFVLGTLWGWLPCGLVYSALVWSSAAGSWQQSGLLMLSFGLGTLPALLVTGLAAQQLRRFVQHRYTRTVSGALILLFGIATIPWHMLLHQHG